MSIFMGVILGKNDDGTYRMQPTRTAHPYNRVPGIDGAVYGVGDEVPYGLVGVGGDTQKPQILARSQRSWPIADEDTSWHCPGYDGRRSFGANFWSVPTSIAAGSELTLDSEYAIDAGEPRWWDETIGKIDCSMPKAKVEISKWVQKSNLAEDPPAQYVQDPQLTFEVDRYPVGTITLAPGEKAPKTTYTLPAEETYVQHGVAYSGTRAWDVLTRTIIWTAPADEDEIVGWTSPVLSADGSMVFSLAEEVTGIPDLAMPRDGNRLQRLWIRAVSAATGAILWRVNITGPPYISSAGLTGRLVYDGAMLYVKYTVLAGTETITDIDLSELTIRKANIPWEIVPGHAVQFVGQFSTRLATIHVYGMTAATGGPMYEAIFEDVYVGWSNPLGRYDSDLMMVGDAVAFTYPKVTMPDSVETVLSIPQGQVQTRGYTTYSGGPDEEYLHPGQNLSRMKGYKLDWAYVIITKDATPKGAPPAWTESQTVFSTEEYDLSMPYNGNPDYHYGHEVLPVYGIEQTSLGMLIDPSQAYPRLRAATSNGSLAAIVKDGGPDGSYWSIEASENYTGAKGAVDCSAWFDASVEYVNYGPSVYHHYSSGPPDYCNPDFFTYECEYTQVYTLIWDYTAEVTVPRPMVVWTVTYPPGADPAISDPVISDPTELLLDGEGASHFATVMAGNVSGAILAVKQNPENTDEYAICATSATALGVQDLKAAPTDLKNCHGLIGFRESFYTQIDNKLRRFS